MTQKKSLAERIVGASIVVGIAHVCLKLAGLIQAKSAAQFLNTAQYETIFAIGFGSIIFNLFSIGEEVIGPTVMPVFMREKEENGEEAAWDAVNVLLTIQVIILLIVTAAIMCKPELFISVTKYQPGSERYELLRKSLVWMAPSLIFLSIGSTTYILLNSYKKFFLAAFGDSSLKICVVVALVGGVGLFGLDHRALYFGVLIGSASKLGTHLIGLWRKFGFVRMSFDVRNRAFQAMLVLMLPLIAGILVAKVRDVVNNAYTLSSITQVGIIQANDMGRKLHASINWIVPFALQIALFPFLCELVDRKDLKKVGEVLTHSCRLLLACFVPGAVCLALLSEWFCVFLFLGGKTGLQVALWAGLSTACYLTVMPGAAIECVLMQGFFANRRMVSVTVIGIICSMLSTVISAVCILYLKVEPMMALVVVALGFAFSRTLKSALLIIYLRQTVPLLPFKDTGIFLIKLVVVGLVVAGATWGSMQGVSRILDDHLEKEKTILARKKAAGEPVVQNAEQVKINKKFLAVKLIVTGALSALAFLLASVIVRLREPFEMMKWAHERVLKKGRPSSQPG